MSVALRCVFAFLDMFYKGLPSGKLMTTSVLKVIALVLLVMYAIMVHISLAASLGYTAAGCCARFAEFKVFRLVQYASRCGSACCAGGCTAWSLGRRG